MTDGFGRAPPPEPALPNPTLTAAILAKEARAFAALESAHAEPTLFGVTDGKAVGTYLELKFRKYLVDRYAFEQGSAAKGIDFPDIGVDIKVTSVKQPQSSCPFRSARQKIFGLGYSLLVFVYEKSDDAKAKTGRLKILHVIMVDAKRTADFQMSRGLLQILDNEGNADDLIAYITDKNLPLDEIEAAQIAEELLKKRPEQGYLTISNALQWRLQYTRTIEQAGKVDGITRIR
jgi:hypothetical protein